MNDNYKGEANQPKLYDLFLVCVEPNRIYRNGGSAFLRDIVCIYTENNFSESGFKIKLTNDFGYAKIQEALTPEIAFEQHKRLEESLRVQNQASGQYSDYLVLIEEHDPARRMIG